LIKKLRRRNIGTHAGANHYLEQEYLAEHNRRFARAPAARENFHRPALSAAELRKVFRLASERVISNDWVVSYGGRSLQLERQSQRYAPAQGKVTVWEAEEGSLEVEYRGQKLEWKEIPHAAGRRAAEVTVTEKNPIAAAARPRAGSRWKPAADHPWRRGYQQRRTQRAASRPATPPFDVVSASASPEPLRLRRRRASLRRTPHRHPQSKEEQKRGHF